MDGSFLRFYLHENQRYHGILLWDWLLEHAARLGIRGGSAFRSMAGFGRHHVVHTDHFFELASNLTVEVEFIVNDEEAKRLIALIEKAGVRLFYARIPARFGVVNPDRRDTPEAAEVAQ
ncbi:MAG TPA: DUF190 domain-containing protein [Burkholderiales bacterium]|nr:DUF190 domain-containing protein [Betaproteobacteria bacterium]HQR52255.1 DUF190 domain-containing protein [Burkholderiales bacterium]